MRVLIINSVCGIKSTGRIVTEIADQYISEGHICKIAYGREKVPDKYLNISYRIGNEFNVRVNGLKARLWDNEGFNAAKSTEEFLQWADEYDPDLLWLHNLHGYYINVELLFQWIKSRPDMKVRWTLHDCWAFTGHCAHFSYVKCNQWTHNCGKCLQKRSYPKSLFYSNSLKNYKKKREMFTNVSNLTIITPSYWLASLVKGSFLRDYEIEVIHNEIDRTIFKPTESNFRKKIDIEDKFVVLGVCSAWNKMKGLDDFVQLAKLLDDRFKVVLVGLNKKQISYIPSEIVCIERTNSAIELAEIYTEADVFLNLTYEDTYPTVNLEAQACGTPCVTYRTGGSVESVLEENIVEQGDLRGILDKIHKLYNDKIGCKG